MTARFRVGLRLRFVYLSQHLACLSSRFPAVVSLAAMGLDKGYVKQILVDIHGLGDNSMV